MSLTSHRVGTKATIDAPLFAPQTYKSSIAVERIIELIVSAPYQCIMLLDVAIKNSTSAQRATFSG